MSTIAARTISALVAAGAIAAVPACRSTPTPHDTKDKGPAPATAAPRHASALDAAPAPAEAVADPPDGSAASAADAGVAGGDPMANHKDTREELLALFQIKDFTEQQKKVIQPEAFLRGAFNVDGPHHSSQGNKQIARHLVSKEQCLAGLKNVVLQTPEQRAKCGAENMVPVWTKGKDAWFCIDIFEFPNKACELPVVWIPPTFAKKTCELQGKRLCSDIEWNVACRGDPEGGADWRYAYGDKLDLEICNTNLRHRTPCNAHDAKTAWNTCTTDSEPSGSFPKCRSRFGVFDQHGNLAEVMMRRESPSQVVTQLKGSAWFYVELAKEPHEPVPSTTTNKQGAHPDHCNFDPRWHVEPIDNAFHVNYHLGFRCCKSIP